MGLTLRPARRTEERAACEKATLVSVRSVMKRALRKFVALGTFGAAGLGAGLASDPAPARGQDCSCTSYRIVNKTVYDEVPVTTWRLEYETVLEERQVTTQRPEWITENRERRFTVARPVTETATREERFIVRRPVTETEFREESFDRVTYVNETEMRQQRILVNRPVVETQMRDQSFVVRRPVQETVMQQQQVSALQPVTTMQTQVLSTGSMQTNWEYVPGRTRNRLTRVPSGYLFDPVTGQPVWQRGGLSWVPQTGPGAFRPQTSFVPNLVTQQVPVTSFMPTTVTQEVPVTVTRFQDEVVSQQVPVQVQRMETTEEIREVPVTVQRPVVERVSYKVPVQRVRWEEEEQVRQIPYTVQRIETEEVVEQVPVRVCRYVTETKTVSVPRTVGRWVSQTSNRLVPRTVTMRVPLNGTYDGVVYEGPTTSYYAPLTLPPATSVRRAESKKEPTPAAPKPEADDLVPAEGTKAEEAETPKAVGEEEADKKPMLPTGPAKGANGDIGGPDLGNASGDKGA